MVFCFAENWVRKSLVSQDGECSGEFKELAKGFRRFRGWLCEMLCTRVEMFTRKAHLTMSDGPARACSSHHNNAPNRPKSIKIL
jgi:hypothetical protein